MKKEGFFPKFGRAVFVVALLFAAVTVGGISGKYINRLGGLDEIAQAMNESNQKLQEKEKEISANQVEIERLKKEAETLQKEKERIRLDLQGKITHLRALPTPQAIKTIKVNQVEFVPKIHYVTMHQLDRALMAALEKYLKIDIQKNATSQEIITLLEKTETLRLAQVNQLLLDRDYFAERASGWGIYAGIGPGLGIDPFQGRAHFSIVFNVSFGKRIW